jgi:hypothetical protein
VQEPYGDYHEPEPKPPMSGWLIALIVILALLVVCCICAVISVAILTLMGPSVGNVFSTILEGIETVTPVP